MYNTRTSQVNEITYLGIQLGRHLTWRRHIECTKINLQLKASSLHWIINALCMTTRSCSTTPLLNQSGHIASSSRKTQANQHRHHHSPRSSVYRWYAKFYRGPSSLQGKFCEDRPKSVLIPETIVCCALTEIARSLCDKDNLRD